MPVCVTSQPEVVRQSIGRGLSILSMDGQLPSYRTMFEREGVDGPADLAIVGTAEQVQEAIVGIPKANTPWVIFQILMTIQALGRPFPRSKP